MLAPADNHVRDEPYDAAQMRRALRPDALRIACYYWFLSTPLDECRKQLWGCGVVLESTRLRAGDFKLHEVVNDELDVQIAWVGEYHTATFYLMRDAASAALLAGQDRLGVMQAAVNVARTRAPVPAPYMVEQAVTAAARNHRFDERFWQQRGRAG